MNTITAVGIDCNEIKEQQLQEADNLSSLRHYNVFS